VRWTKTLLAVSTAAAVVPPAWAASPSRGFHLVAQTTHVSYYSEGRGRVDVKRSEAFLARLTEVFGPVPKGWRIEYYLHSPSEGIRTQDGAAAIGLTDLAAGRIDSVRAFHPHELVHAVAGRLGRCPAFFAEGLAVALAGERQWGGRDVDGVARETLASGARLEPFLTRFFEQDPDRSYPLAGSFVAFLLDEDGIDAFVAFLEGCASTPRAYETAFRRAYGRTVAGAVLAWRAALRRGEAARWTWTDPGSWPNSLHRASGSGAQRMPGAPAVRAAATPAGDDVLLSRERR
jgi:hypothetical protein